MTKIGMDEWEQNTNETRRKRSIVFKCDYCGKINEERPSHYKKSKLHFCNKYCYAAYRREMMPFWEQNAYKGIRQKQENKQVYHRRYVKTHPERIAHLKARRYAVEKGADGSHTLEEWEQLKEQYDGRCAKCGENKPLTKDHIIPLSEGGTDFIANIQPLCRNCNSKKWKTIENPDIMEQR